MLTCAHSNDSTHSFRYPFGKMPEDTVGDQTRKALASLDARLAEAGTNKSKILEATVFLSDMASDNSVKSSPNTYFFVTSRTLTACTDPRRGKVGTPNQCPLGSIASCFIYAYMRTF